MSHKFLLCVSSSQTHWASPCLSSSFLSPTQTLLPLKPSPVPPAHPRLTHSSPACLTKRPQPEPAPRELDLLRYDMKELFHGPKPALYLGFSGLLPFVCPSLFMAATEIYIPEVAFAQVAYGASILSFLGGVRWGFALPPGSPEKPDWLNLGNSVVPSLLAWVSLLLVQTIVPAAIMVIMGLGVALHYDLALLPTYPRWFKAMRAVLTIVATASLGATLLVYGAFPEKRLNDFFLNN
ncbi:unnamed protein product [Knipowitschia caucasica]|uniref:Transmembrane protein 69 n=1 Tax=Knipowitschia caucasica TaxID=637954 RepID=A0AAV2KTJ1_KNICA